MKAGEFLKKWIYASDVSQAEFAKKLGVSPVELNHLIVGKRSITVEWAIRLEGVTGIPSIIWLTYRNHDDLMKRKYETTTGKENPIQ